MKLSRSSSQAAIAMAFLACNAGSRPVQARHVAEHLGIPTDSALKILQALARNDLIASRLGRAGGYQLLRPPEQTSLLQIVEVMDGPVAGIVGISEPKSDLAPQIDVLRDLCQRIAHAARGQLQQTTVADLTEVQP